MSQNNIDQILRTMYPTRSWADISGYWLNYVDTISPPGAKPSSPADEFIPFGQVANRLSDRYSQERVDIDGFREIIFREAIFLLHKASHVIGNAEIDANSGARTWSLSQAYQGSYFAAKSICHLLGGILAEAPYENKRKGIFVDIWPGFSTTSRNGLGLSPDTTIAFRFYRYNVGHVHVWQLFQQLLSVTRVGFWPAEYIDAIISLAPMDFPAQRNVIHYGGASWLFDDLFEFKPDSEFGAVESRLSSGLQYHEDSDFTFVLAQIIFRMAYLLLDDMCALTNKLDDEMNIIRNRLSKEFHPYYVREFNI